MENLEENKNIVKKISLDVKDILIVLLILFCIWLFFKPSSNSKISQLEEDNKNKDKVITEIQWQRDSLLLERKVIDGKLESLKKLSQSRSDTIINLTKLSASKQAQINSLKEDLKFWDDFLTQQEKKILDLEKKPIILPKDQIVDKTKDKLK